MSNTATATPKRKYAKHKLRYWFVCESCGARKRSPRKGTKYCIDNYACRQFAYRQRKKEREEAAQARALEMAAANAKRVREVLERRDKARQDRAWREAQKEAENRANLERQEKQRAIEQDRANRTVIQPCECGHSIWLFYPEEKPLLGKIKPAHMDCVKCGKRTEGKIAAKPCPHCQGSWCYINRYGQRKCKACDTQF